MVNNNLYFSESGAMMLVLGSQSKVRYQLLRLYNAEIEVMSANIDETFVQDKSIEENVKYLAYKKAQALLPKIDAENDILICADTIVVVDNEVLNKPKNYNEAFSMIKSLSNKTIKVMSGVYLSHNNDIHNFVETSSIIFNEISDEKIIEYLRDNDNYLEVAGALMIEHIHKYVQYSYEGSFSNIMGLPMEKVSSLLYNAKDDNMINFSTEKLEPINIYRSSVRAIIRENNKVVLLNGYTFDKKHTFLMSIGGGYHYFENEEEMIKKEAAEEGGLIITNLKHLENMKEYTNNNRYINYNKLTIHSYYVADIKEYTSPSYVEYEQELLIGIARYSLDEAIEIIKKQVSFFEREGYNPVSNMSRCDLEILSKIKKEKII
ncbi:MAF protein [Bacilli bacterium PM5-9]|nr:MAF protein [Bacilli bacterium PM5-9]